METSKCASNDRMRAALSRVSRELFLTSGRLPRSRWLVRVLAILGVTWIACILSLAIVHALLGPDVKPHDLALTIAAWLGIIGFWSFVAQCAKRLHDQDHRGWWLIGILAFAVLSSMAGVVSLLFWGIFLFWMLRSGTEGPNRFGPPV